ncbi:hypothetical protein F5B22DRAFT_178669 [Xylaria bambusicola]|uniref:uncharacterized protein n=1 Tax=Xylaria bambusicola TaxID=326684 RepID=UPI002008B7D4|nr:uncharacterized protein F5B22DRAFT_178669 [Xylaria bambusicola]KAI0516738.1 hypothetical protein F5B22DRAFT_178669 [Xylaria bambusicola]
MVPGPLLTVRFLHYPFRSVPYRPPTIHPSHNPSLSLSPSPSPSSCLPPTPPVAVLLILSLLLLSRANSLASIGFNISPSINCFSPVALNLPLLTCRSSVAIRCVTLPLPRFSKYPACASWIAPLRSTTTQPTAIGYPDEFLLGTGRCTVECDPLDDCSLTV